MAGGGAWWPRVRAVPRPCQGAGAPGGHAPLPSVGLPGRVGGQRGPPAHRRQRRRPDSELVRSAGCCGGGVAGCSWGSPVPPGCAAPWGDREELREVAGLSRGEDFCGYIARSGRCGQGAWLNRGHGGPGLSGATDMGWSANHVGRAWGHLRLNTALRTLAAGAEAQGSARPPEGVCLAPPLTARRPRKTHEAKPVPFGRGAHGSQRCLAVGCGGPRAPAAPGRVRGQRESQGHGEGPRACSSRPGVRDGPRASRDT